jgi:hypothetical protein
MKTATLFSFIVCFLMLISCCNVLFPDENLTIKRRDYTGNELRTDGYFYFFQESTNLIYVRFLYRNGIILSVGGYSPPDLEEVEKRILNPIMNSKDHWGVFVVDGNTIKYEKWIGSSSSSPKAYLYNCTGNILNDTTIHFTESYNSESNKTNTINEVWHFRRFSPKPDSTNVYIK